MTQRKQLALIDGHALAYRAFHALSGAGLRAANGEPTYAVFGFAQVLLTMIQEQHPDYVAVAFDVGRTFRDDLYAEYKANRAETPDEFEQQLARIKHLVTALNVPIYTAEGYEADDVIGTLARQATDQDVDTLILTGDTDTLQLVDEHVRVLLANPYGQKTSTTIYDVQKVHERYKGLAPNQLADLRGLKGDASDNLPGVKGIGETGAINLLNEFRTIENLYEHLDAVQNRYRKHLTGQRDQALFSKQLAQIVCDAPVALDLQAATLRDYDRNAVLNLFQELEFGSSLTRKLPASGAAMDVQDLPPTNQQHMFDPPAPVPPIEQAPAGSNLQLALFDLPPAAAGSTSLIAQAAPVALGEYTAVTTEDALREVINALNAAPGFAFDTEGTGLRPFESNLVGISLAIRPGAAWYIPVGHRTGEQLPIQQVLQALRPFFNDPQKPKYAHNAKFDMEMLLQAGIEVRGLTFDTLLAAKLLGKRASLKDLAFYELHPPVEMTPIEDLIGRGQKQITFDHVPIEPATLYAAADADMTLRLKQVFEPQLAAEERTRKIKISTDIELPLIPILVAMEHAGIALDTDYMRELSQRLGARLGELEAEIYAYAERPFNINSSDQLSDVLFNKLGVSKDGVGRTSKTKKYSLTADTLEKMRDRHQIIDLILQHRQLGKLKSTYVDALPALVNPKTGRIHTSYNQLGAATGRLSSNDPNLQNIPIRTEEGREIRRAFVAAPGHTFVAADYSQIELRVLAHITQDKNLVRAFQEGQDIHAATAAQLFSVPIDAVDKNQRRLAKTVVFGVIYGISSFGLAQRTSLSRSEAQSLIDALFARFPGVRTYIDTTLEQGKIDGYVQSLFGRRRHIRELQSSSAATRQAAEREAINAPIQATAADIMKIAMIQVSTALTQRNLRTRLLLQVHDELILEAPDDEVDATCQMIREVMERAYNLEHESPEGKVQVPLKADVEVGKNWEEMQAVR